jgi:hypothetical protein
MEATFGEADHLCYGFAEWHVGCVDERYYVVFGLHVIIVVMVLTNLKKTIALQAVRRMHLKAKTNIFHDFVFLALKKF